MARIPRKPADTELVTEIKPIKMRGITVFLRGVSPLIMHRFATKAWQELLYPSNKKNAAERAQTLKHDPITEYRECFYRNRNPKSPAMFHLPNGTPHQSFAAAALDIPGFTRAATERWIQVTDLNIEFFGIPQLFMAMVRSSDINRTPDVRTRPIFPEWACRVTVSYKADPLTDNNMLNLIGAAGQIVGFGDWRPQRGGPFGKFIIVNPNDDKDFKRIVAKQGRAAQQEAYNNPTYYDEETEEIMTWFLAEVRRRRQDGDDIGLNEVNKETSDASTDNIIKTLRGRGNGKRSAA